MMNGVIFNHFADTYYCIVFEEILNSTNYWILSTGKLDDYLQFCSRRVSNVEYVVMTNNSTVQQLCLFLTLHPSYSKRLILLYETKRTGFASKLIHLHIDSVTINYGIILNE